MNFCCHSNYNCVIMFIKLAWINKIRNNKIINNNNNNNKIYNNKIINNNNNSIIIS